MDMGGIIAFSAGVPLPHSQEAPDPSLNARIRERLRNRIMNDKTLLDGRLLKDVRKMFNLLTGGGEYVPKSVFCIVMIDEEVLQVILHAPEPERNCDSFKATLESVFVKVIDGVRLEEDELYDDDDDDNSGGERVGRPTTRRTRKAGWATTLVMNAG